MRRPRLLDAVIASLAGAAVFTAVWIGASQAEGPPRRSAAFERALSVHAGVDPLKPPGMPPGASVDPETGILIGVDLRPADGELGVPWSVLAPASAVETAADLPQDIQDLDGRRVVLAGFVMALYEIQAMRDFVLVGSHYTCCFGTPPGFGDQIRVALRRDHTRLDATPVPVRVAGTLKIDPEHLFEGGRGPLIGLFRIVDADVVPYDG